MGRILLRQRLMLFIVPAVMLAALPTTRPNEANDFGSVARIQRHLRAMVTTLRTTDASALGPERTSRRALLIDRLAAYAERGVFPHNHVLPHQNPIFIDEHGTACAVGQLIIESGHRELAERVQAQDNTGYLLELDVDGLAEWIAASGFSADELAHIQPSYGPSQPDDTFIVQTTLDGALTKTTRVARRPWWGASSAPVKSVAEFDDQLFFTESTWQPGIHRLSDSGRVIEREQQIERLFVADETLFALRRDGLATRSTDGGWAEVAALAGRAVLQVNASNDVFLLESTETSVAHFDGSMIRPVAEGLARDASDVFVTTDQRVYFLAKGLFVARRGQSPKRLLDTATDVFGAGNDVYAIRDEEVLRVNATDEVTSVYAGLGADPTSGAVLRDGRVAVVGAGGRLTLRDASGAWRTTSLGATKARFASVVEGTSGLLLTVDGIGCSEQDWLCDARVPSKPLGCSAGIGAPGLLALIAIFATRRRRS